VGRETSLTLPFESENVMKGSTSRGTLPAKSSAACGPVSARSDRIAHDEPTERSAGTQSFS
jgi:hypothetical protein